MATFLRGLRSALFGPEEPVRTDEFDSMTLSSLRNACREKGLNVSGTKAQLCERLRDPEGNKPRRRRLSASESSDGAVEPGGGGSDVLSSMKKKG